MRVAAAGQDTHQAPGAGAHSAGRGGAGTRELGPGRALNPQEALRAGACRGGGNQLASPFHGKDRFLCAACSHCLAGLGGPRLTSPRE